MAKTTMNVNLELETIEKLTFKEERLGDDFARVIVTLVSVVTNFDNGKCTFTNGATDRVGTDLRGDGEVRKIGHKVLAGKSGKRNGEGRGKEGRWKMKRMEMERKE
jgi:hypothetical protein